METVSVDVVRFLKESKHLSLTEIAQMIDVSQSFVSRVNSGGRSFTLHHLHALAEKMEIPLPLLVLISTREDSLSQSLALQLKIVKQAIGALNQHFKQE